MGHVHASLRPGGRLVTCGGTGGVDVELNLPRLFLSQHEVIGSTMGTFKEFDELTALVAGGLPVVVDSVYDMADYPCRAGAPGVGGAVRQGRPQALTGADSSGRRSTAHAAAAVVTMGRMDKTGTLGGRRQLSGRGYW